MPARAGAAVSHGPGHRPRDRGRPAGLRLSRSCGRSTCRSTRTSWTGCSARTSRAGHIRSPFDIRDVWPSSYSSNTNEILWGAKVAARLPWVTCVIRLASYECGMDQPTYTPVQQIVERSGTLFFSFQDLDSTKPAGSVKIRVETIAHYLEKYSARHHRAEAGGEPAGLPAPAWRLTPDVGAGRAGGGGSRHRPGLPSAVLPGGPTRRWPRICLLPRRRSARRRGSYLASVGARLAAPAAALLTVGALRAIGALCAAPGGVRPAQAAAVAAEPAAAAEAVAGAEAPAGPGVPDGVPPRVAAAAPGPAAGRLAAEAVAVPAREPGPGSGPGVTAARHRGRVSPRASVAPGAAARAAGVPAARAPSGARALAKAPGPREAPALPAAPRGARRSGPAASGASAAPRPAGRARSRAAPAPPRAGRVRCPAAPARCRAGRSAARSGAAARAAAPRDAPAGPAAPRAVPQEACWVLAASLRCAPSCPGGEAASGDRRRSASRCTRSFSRWVRSARAARARSRADRVCRSAGRPRLRPRRVRARGLGRRALRRHRAWSAAAAAASPAARRPGPGRPAASGDRACRCRDRHARSGAPGRARARSPGSPTGPTARPGARGGRRRAPRSATTAPRARPAPARDPPKPLGAQGRREVARLPRHHHGSLAHLRPAAASRGRSAASGSRPPAAPAAPRAPA